MDGNGDVHEEEYEEGEVLLTNDMAVVDALWIVGGVEMRRWGGGKGGEGREGEVGGEEVRMGKRWWWRRMWNVGRGCVTVNSPPPFFWFLLFLGGCD